MVDLPDNDIRRRVRTKRDWSEIYMQWAQANISAKKRDSRHEVELAHISPLCWYNGKPIKLGVAIDAYVEHIDDSDFPKDMQSRCWRAFTKMRTEVERAYRAECTGKPNDKEVDGITGWTEWQSGW